MAVGGQQTLGEARELMSAFRFADARQLLSNALAEAPPDRFRVFASGMLGECLFQLGDAAGAIEPTTTALRLWEEQGDQPGVVAYLENLVEIHRYLGRAEPATA